MVISTECPICGCEQVAGEARVTSTGRDENGMAVAVFVLDLWCLECDWRTTPHEGAD